MIYIYLNLADGPGGWDPHLNRQSLVYLLHVGLDVGTQNVGGRMTGLCSGFSPSVCLAQSRYTHGLAVDSSFSFPLYQPSLEEYPVNSLG